MEQKERIDDQLREIHVEIEQVERDLKRIPRPADLETLEVFCSRIAAVIAQERTVSSEMKRKILETLHIKVFIDGPAWRFRIEGWFGPPVEGPLSTTSG